MVTLTSFPNGLSISGFPQSASATMTVGIEAADAINVVLQLTDGNGEDMSVSSWCMFYLADDAAGDTPSAVAPTGGIVIGTDGALIEWTANLSGIAISESDGDIDITLTDTGTPTFYFVALLPTGKRVVSAAITFS
jgi:hypothetical protein